VPRRKKVVKSRITAEKDASFVGVVYPVVVVGGGVVWHCGVCVLVVGSMVAVR